MEKFRFHTPITVNYGDIDAQWHVNNKVYLSYIESARFRYLREVGLLNGETFLDLPFIVADVHIRYLAPIELFDEVEVWMGVTRIGNKSLTVECAITAADGSKVYAAGETVLVSYDYHTKKSVPVSAEIRKCFSDYEGRYLTEEK